MNALGSVGWQVVNDGELFLLQELVKKNDLEAKIHINHGDSDALAVSKYSGFRNNGGNVVAEIRLS